MFFPWPERVDRPPAIRLLLPPNLLDRRSPGRLRQCVWQLRGGPEEHEAIVQRLRFALAGEIRVQFGNALLHLRLFPVLRGSVTGSQRGHRRAVKQGIRHLVRVQIEVEPWPCASGRSLPELQRPQPVAALLRPRPPPCGPRLLPGPTRRPTTPAVPTPPSPRAAGAAPPVSGPPRRGFDHRLHAQTLRGQ